MEIERGIAIPDCISMYPFPEMDVGDSVFIANATTAGSEYASARNYGFRYGKKFKARKANNGEVFGIRIWRIA